ncbi:IucA/IucC family protein [Kribbella speibonae]|uniref:IucA/IucC family siderophore biosynthesis protein n=1 Tax=Kribbella speibonae TaxID=1572660 RepID=A0A4R0JKD7_9ACTN|nr:IucA/IucC family siderophore biosynthesis protein [Kribbella speibonae]TCC42265.1 IucA/IucC family siderophore biosynthesis protein [Kribbella speibonae]
MDSWATVNQALVRKALAEFTHERILEPVADGNRFVLGRYSFAARRYPLNHWDISDVVREDGAPVDALEFITEFHEQLGIGREMLPVYLEEISSTLASAAYKLSKPDLTATDLVTADFQTIEAGMTEGHPCFVANNGRLGFGLTDYLAYAPETGAGVQLTWIATRRDRTTVSCSSSVDFDSLMQSELGEDVLARFATVADPAEYVYLPVHPWQWDNKTSITFAADIALRHIVHLGSTDDVYQPQQSIRTFFNRSEPSRCYVKTALSVLNMGFMRGLSPSYMAATPAINDWVHSVVSNDLVLKRYGFTVLREIAAAGYHNRYYENATDKTSPYRKMLSALWRESPVPSLEPGERLATMASLLHVDRHGASVAAALVRASGLAPADWLRAYVDAYLIPLLHSFYAYELVFMPHGENLILVLRDAIPIRVIMKDIAEEIAVLSPSTVVPPEAERVRADVPDDEKLLSIFTDVFDCIFRFLSPLLDREGLLTPAEFWSVVSEAIRDYQAATPELAEAFAKYDIFAPSFALSCLNRLQLRNNQQMVDLTDVAGSLQFVGTLDNPLVTEAAD